MFRREAKPDLWERTRASIKDEGYGCPFSALEQLEQGDQVVLAIIRPETQEEG